MLKRSLSNHPMISECILYFRQNIFLVGILIFLALNWGNSIKTLKFSFSYFWYVQMSERAQLEEYPDLISVENAEVMGTTLCFAVISLFIVMLLMWYIDTIGLRRSLMTRELRHLSKSVKEKKRLLAEQEKLLSDLIKERRSNDELQTIILKMEEILQRYEHTAKALNPDSLKRAKLSETDPSFQDLFDFSQSQNEAKPKLKHPRRSKKSKIKF